MWETDFIHDLRWLNSKQLSDKYTDKIPEGTTIKRIADTALAHNNLPPFIVTDWEQAKKDWHHGFFIEKRANQTYFIFDWERGIKNPLREHESLKEAVMMFIQLRLNNFHYRAQDEDPSIYA